MLAAFTLFFLMWVTAADVLGRYFFGKPLAGSTEMIEFGLGIAIFAALPLLCANNDHVTVDLLEHRLPNAVKKTRAIAVRVAWALSLLTLAYGLLSLGQREQRDEIVSETLALPTAWFFYLMAAFGLVAALAAAFSRHAHGTDISAASADTPRDNAASQ